MNSLEWLLHLMALFEIDVTWWTWSWSLVSSSVRVCVSGC